MLSDSALSNRSVVDVSSGCMAIISPAESLSEAFREALGFRRCAYEFHAHSARPLPELLRADASPSFRKNPSRDLHFLDSEALSRLCLHLEIGFTVLVGIRRRTLGLSIEIRAAPEGSLLALDLAQLAALAFRARHTRRHRQVHRRGTQAGHDLRDKPDIAFDELLIADLARRHAIERDLEHAGHRWILDGSGQRIEQSTAALARHELRLRALHRFQKAPLS